MPTSATLDQVVALNTAARGVPGPGVHVEDWDVRGSGGRRTVHAVYRGADYFEIYKHGPLTYEDGRYQGQAWFQNVNGETVLRSKPEPGAEEAEESLAPLISDGFTLRLLGEVTTPTAAYVVEVHPPTGDARWFYVEKATGRIIEHEYPYSSRHQVATIDDFRTSDGETRAWHVRFSYENSDNAIDYTMRSFDANATLPETAFHIPPNRRVVDVFPSGVTKVQLPAQFLDLEADVTGRGSEVLLRVNLGERAVDMILDSGSSGLFINRDLAKELGYEIVGDDAIVPKLTIGSLELDNVVFSTLPFQQETGYAAKAVGLLGFDFIADAVIHIDYNGEKVEAIDPDHFSPDQFPGALKVPLTLDHQLPVAPAQIGNAAGHFLLDTGAFASFVTAEFAKLHPSDVADRGAGALSSSLSHFQYAGAVNGPIRIFPVPSRSSRLRGNRVHTPHDLSQRLAMVAGKHNRRPDRAGFLKILRSLLRLSRKRDRDRSE